MRVIPITLDRAGSVPLYHQLAEQLTAAIEDGRLGPGDPFENELALAERLELSRPTVRRAIAELVRRGLIIRRRGVGTTVANPVIHRHDTLTSLYEDLVSRGQRPTTSVLSLDTGVINPAAARALELPTDTPLVSVERLRTAGGIPTALMHNFLPPQAEAITREQLEENGLYAVLRSLGLRPTIAHQTIGARRPTARERRLLALAAGDPLLTMNRRAFGARGEAVEFGDHCYRYDQYAFDLTVHEA